MICSGEGGLGLCCRPLRSYDWSGSTSPSIKLGNRVSAAWSGVGGDPSDELEAPLEGTPATVTTASALRAPRPSTFQAW